MCVPKKGLLVVTDFCNNSVKAIEFDESIKTTAKIVSHFQLSSNPRGISAISESRFIVALPSRGQLQIFNIRYVTSTCMIESESTIEASGKCNGVDYDKESDSIAVAYDEPPHVVLDKDGTLIYKIQNDALFREPFHVRFGLGIATNETFRCIYVSDRSTKIITCIRLEDQQIMLKIKDINVPRDICVLSDNSKLVCAKSESCIYHVFASDGRYSNKSILDESNELKSPCAMAYSKEDNKLFVSGNIIHYLGKEDTDLSDYIKVYDLDETALTQLE